MVQFINRTHLLNRIKHSNILLLFLKFLRNIINSCKTKVIQDNSDLVFIKEVPSYRVRKISKILDNNLYGLDYVIEAYNLDLDKTYIEHGLFVGGFVKDDIFNIPGIQNIMTFGNYRANIIKASGWQGNIVQAGPYIKHFKPLTNQNLLLQSNGFRNKTLVFFPSHSVNGLKREFNVKKTIEKIRSAYPEFKTIIVNLYYLDFNEENIKKYQENGCLLTTAGHKYDMNFLPRLRSIIELGDHTVSNKFGTHVGYCLALGKPHHIIASNDIIETPLNISGYEELNSPNRTTDDYEFIEDMFNKTFEHRESGITTKQMELYKNYFC